MNNPKQKLSMSNPWHLLAIGFGSGLSPWVPGTMGTLASVPFALLLSGLSPAFYALIVGLACVVGVKICDITARDMGVHDHGSIVWDEFAGFWITMLPVIFYAPSVLDWHYWLTGFVLFRFFDMLKPWPISWLDKKVHGGLGIMVDDIVAGVVSALCLLAIAQYAGWW
ncbi:MULTISPECIES: phosphatidylglycerophosphatase A [unclassified Vibrio]|uniref:Phosphatidylglycerophosphatase A n=1 Tax=Vibrio sp. HB236076 TaxID=3232307 RepID=A0AB39HE05_9VIBR|nr:phosphatidylglycerophosphatase A [Vibrio sp. HB161653]MDP5254181.1 phosphatidylglycerophosphatase A [Vibrio sp. HB161653]